MAALIGSLRVNLSADSAAFHKGMTAAERKAKQSASNIQKAFSGIQAAAAGIVTGVALGAMVKLGSAALDYASSLGEVAQQLGISSKALQEYRYIATQTGIAQEEMDKGLAKLTVSLGQVAQGAKGPTDALKRLHFSTDEIARISKMGAEDAFPLLADALNRLPNAADRSAIGVALMGRSFQKFLPLVAEGSKGINSFREAAHKLGMVLSEEQIQKADKTADKLAEVRKVLEANIAGTVSDNADSILSLANSLSVLTGEIVKFMASNPKAALAIIGALAGSRFGLPGAAVGAVAGLAAGGHIQRSGEDANADVNFRLQKMREAGARYHDFKKRGMDTRPAEAEYRRQIDLARGAIGSGSAGAMQATATPTEPPAIIDSKSGRGSGGRSVEQAREEAARAIREAAEALRQFTDDMARGQAELASLNADLSQSAEERIAAEITGIDIDRQIQAREIEADDALSAAQKGQKLALIDDIANKRIAVVEQQEANRLAQINTRIQQDKYDQEIELLGYQSQLAETAAERRDIELRILELALERERVELEGIVASKEATEADRARARARLGALGQIGAAQAQSIHNDTMGPLEGYLNSLPDTAARANEALEGVAAGGIASIVDGLAAAGAGVTSLGEVFSRVAQQIIADLIRIQLQRAIVSGLTSALGGGSLSQLGTVQSNIANWTPSFEPVKLGFARGGSFTIGGSAGYDTNLMSINNQPVARVSKGETVAVTPNNARSRGGETHIHVTVAGGGTRDANRQTGMQVAAAARAELARSAKGGF